MLRYYELLTVEDVGRLRRELGSGAAHPMDAKKRLARLMVARFYDDATAQRAFEQFAQRFQRRELPDEVPAFAWQGAPPEELSLVDVIAASGLVQTKSETRRLIQQGAVRVNGQRVRDIHQRVAPSREKLVIQVGSRRVVAVDFFPFENSKKRG